MPIYEYECQDCGCDFEKHHYGKGSQVVECPKCGGPSEKQFSPPTVIQTGYKESDARYNRRKG